MMILNGTQLDLVSFQTINPSECGRDAAEGVADLSNEKSSSLSLS